MSRLANGDAEALNDIVSQWQLPVFAFVQRQLKGAPEVEDITNQVFWKAYQARNRVRSEGAFATWIFRIAYNLCMEHFRAEKRKTPALSLDELGERGMELPEAPQRGDPHYAILDKELSGAIECAIAALPPKQKAAFLLCKSEGLTYREVAETLRCTVASVESLVFRARQNLMRDLAPYLKDTE